MIRLQGAAIYVIKISRERQREIKKHSDNADTSTSVTFDLSSKVEPHTQTDTQTDTQIDTHSYKLQ